MSPGNSSLYAKILETARYYMHSNSSENRIEPAHRQKRLIVRDHKWRMYAVFEGFQCMQTGVGGVNSGREVVSQHFFPKSTKARIFERLTHAARSNLNKTQSRVKVSVNSTEVVRSLPFVVRIFDKHNPLQWVWAAKRRAGKGAEYILLQSVL
jgi:hypothetical protein